MTNQPDKNEKRDALLRIADAHSADVLAAPRNEIVEDAAAMSMDLKANAQSMRDILTRAELQVGKKAMAAAQAAIRSPSPVTVSPRRMARQTSAAANDAHVLTLAARNGSEQSDRDKITIQEDMDELDALIAQRDDEP
jgi:hypothetical protein